MDISLEPDAVMARGRRQPAAVPTYQPPLRIWHVGASASPDSVNGVNTVIWRLAAHQSRLGHRIHVLLLETGRSRPRHVLMDGIHRHEIQASSWRFSPDDLRRLLAAHRPDAVHLHSAFVPRHTLLGRFLAREGIPYVVTPHGALLPEVLERGRFKKRVYTDLLERTYMRKAAAVTALTPSEMEAISAYTGGTGTAENVIFNPVPLELENRLDWRFRAGRPSIVFLGRFDVEVKGLDRLMEVARLLPDADFELYGRPQDARGRRIAAEAPRNVRFREPVYGAAKSIALTSATLYIQPSRWEAFPLSAVEAMALGVPCAMSEHLHLAQMLEAEEAVLPLPPDAAGAALRLREIAGDPQRLLELSRRGSAFVREHCSPREIAGRYVDLYRKSSALQNHLPHLRKL